MDIGGMSQSIIQRCTETDFSTIVTIINEAAVAYRGVIPADCWHEPYMSSVELMAEINAGIDFWGWYESDILLGVMGIQKVLDATLIRHAYVRQSSQGKGIGGALLTSLVNQNTGPLLVGTWAAASWAIRLYQRHGFSLVTPAEKDRLLSTYWSISVRQRETSVVLLYNGLPSAG
jgi:GNAT superfamily N-acetyltransferase